MDTVWTSHRFSGGMLALDLVNTIICRNDPARRADRLAGRTGLTDFAAAVSQFRREELCGKAVALPDHGDWPKLLALREAVDGWLRPQAEGRHEAGAALGRLFAAAAVCADTGGGGQSTVALGRAAAVSAMKLLDEALRKRVKICPGCDWLFVDRSKNRSRIWCDMAVCGNRAKASGHYLRMKAAGNGAGAEA